MESIARIFGTLRKIPLGRKFWAAAFLVVGMVLIVLGGRLLSDVYHRQNAPCEVSAVYQGQKWQEAGAGTSSAGGSPEASAGSQSASLSRAMDAAMKMEGVLGLTRVWYLPGRIVCGDYHADVNFVGLSPEYLKGDWILGGTFSEGAAMPQCVLSLAAAGAFRDEKGKVMKLSAKTDWQSADVSIAAEPAVDVRVTGVIETLAQSNAAAAGTEAIPTEITGQSALPEVYLGSREVRGMLTDRGIGSSDGELRILFEHKRDLDLCQRQLSLLGIIVTSSDGQDEVIGEQKEKALLYLTCAAVCLAAAAVTSVLILRLLSREEAAVKAHVDAGGEAVPLEERYNVFSRAFGTFFRHSFCSPAGLAAIAAVPVIIGISGADQIIDAVRQGITFSYGFPLNYVLQGVGGDVMTFLIPLLCALPCSAGYVDDMKSGAVRLILPRSSKKDYLLGKILSCMVSGGLVLACGIALASALAVALLRFFEAPAAAQGALSAGSAAAAQIRSLGLELFWKTLLCVLSGMVWAGVGMLASAFTGSRYVAYLSPFIVYYLLIILCERYFSGIRVLYPKEWLAPGEWWPFGKIGAAAWLAELAVLIVLAFLAQGEKRLESV